MEINGKTIITSNNADQKPKKNFIGLDDDYASLKKAKVAILPVPYDETTTYIKGTKAGPGAMIDASFYLERYDDELNMETFKVGIHTMDALLCEGVSPEDMVQKVYVQTAETLKLGKFQVMLGGEHTVTVGAVKAFKEAYPDISVLQLDAHYDLRDEYYGSKLNHGCVARRISEICPIVQVGTRSLSKEEKDFLASQPNSAIKTISVYDILDMPMWKDAVIDKLSENIYITVDLDVFDPSIMPAVGTPEPGGIGWYETLDLLKEVSRHRKIVGFDVVELCPINGQVASDFLAAKLIYRLLGYAFSSKK